MGVVCTHRRTADLGIYDKIGIFQPKLDNRHSKHVQLIPSLMTCGWSFYPGRPHIKYHIVFIHIHPLLPLLCLRRRRVARQVATSWDRKPHFTFYSRCFCLVELHPCWWVCVARRVDVRQGCTKTPVSGTGGKKKSQNQTWATPFGSNDAGGIP